VEVSSYHCFDKKNFDSEITREDMEKLASIITGDRIGPDPDLITF
jgi:hypothetical protein